MRATGRSASVKKARTRRPPGIGSCTTIHPRPPRQWSGQLRARSSAQDHGASRTQADRFGGAGRPEDRQAERRVRRRRSQNAPSAPPRLALSQPLLASHRHSVVALALGESSHALPPFDAAKRQLARGQGASRAHRDRAESRFRLPLCCPRRRGCRNKANALPSEERPYIHAMGMPGVGPHQTWMVGGNLEWEIPSPQLLGIYAILHDGYGLGPSQTPQSAPTVSSAVCWNCWSSRTLCFLSLSAALWSFAGGARAQTSPGSAYNRLAVTQAICRQYAAMQRALPYDTMYAQCMYARGYRVPGLSPSPDSPGYQGELPGPPAHKWGCLKRTITFRIARNLTRSLLATRLFKSGLPRPWVAQRHRRCGD
jgi:hypothetical protein